MKHMNLFKSEFPIILQFYSEWRSSNKKWFSHEGNINDIHCGIHTGTLCVQTLPDA